MGRPRVDIAGKVFSEIYTAIEIADATDNRHPKWKVKCFRGHVFTSTYSDLNRGRKKLCPDCRLYESNLSPVKSLYSNYQRGALKRGLAFELQLSEFQFLIEKDCQYCGAKPSQYYKKKDMKVGLYYNGIDRRVNTIGYKLNNCLTCCKFCNYAKGKSTPDEFDAWVSRLVEFRNAMPYFWYDSDKVLHKQVKVITWKEVPTDG